MKTNLEKAQRWLKTMHIPEFSDFASGAREFARFQDEQEKHKHEYSGSFYRKCDCGAVELVEMIDEITKPTPEPKECYCKNSSCQEGCVRKHTHKQFFCDVCAPASFKVQPTPVPEELKNIGCPCRCRGMDMCPHNERKICGCRNCTLESKLNELIRWARSLQPRNQ